MYHLFLLSKGYGLLKMKKANLHIILASNHKQRHVKIQLQIILNNKFFCINYQRLPFLKLPHTTFPNRLLR